MRQRGERSDEERWRNEKGREGDQGTRGDDLERRECKVEEERRRKRGERRGAERLGKREEGKKRKEEGSARR